MGARSPRAWPGYTMASACCIPRLTQGCGEQDRQVRLGGALVGWSFPACSALDLALGKMEIERGGWKELLWPRFVTPFTVLSRASCLTLTQKYTNWAFVLMLSGNLQGNQISVKVCLLAKQTNLGKLICCLSTDCPGIKWNFWPHPRKICLNLGWYTDLYPDVYFSDLKTSLVWLLN